NKLPTMWIALPRTLKKANPEWENSLRYNSNQLTSPFDIYETLKDILNNNSTVKPAQGPLQRGLSLFQMHPPRSCHEAGIPPEFCACASPLEYSGDMSIIQLAADAVVKKINAELPSYNCS